MNAIDLLLLLSLITLGAAVLLSASLTGRMLTTMGYAVQLVALFKIDPASVQTSSVVFNFLNHSISWSFNGLSWFFALITIGTAFLVSWFATSHQQKMLHGALAVNVFVMLLLLSSGDFLSLFISWELVSWAGVLLMMLGKEDSLQATLRYITYAIAGGMSVLAGIVLIYNWTGSLNFDALYGSNLNPYQYAALAVLFIGGFSVKMGLMPFHLWQAPAYALTAGPATSFLGAISSRMGLFAIIVTLMHVVSLETLQQLELIPDMFSVRNLLIWIAAISIVLPTFTALRQNDARLLLAWHGIGQGGYMMLGLLMFDRMGSAGGLMHVFNHASYQAALFMSVFAIIHRTGTSDLNKLGGLVARMPLSFLVMLIGIIGLAGLPPMNGFVSKWLVYRSLLNEGMPLVFLAAVIGTLGTILSVYKLLHNSFLGQLRVEHEHIKEAPWSMTIPMLLLSVVVLVTGVMPGLILEYVVSAQLAMGLTPIDYHLGGITSSGSNISGDLDMIWVVVVLFSGFGIAAILFLSTGKSRRVHQLDNYAGGHFLNANNQYQYSDNFYAGLMHIIKPWYRYSFKWFEGALTSFVNLASVVSRSFFNQAHMLILMLVAVTAMMAVVII